MNNKKKGANIISAEEIMTLEFFSRRFGIKKTLLSWGVVVALNEDAEITTTAAILIKGSHLFIDIVNDRLSPLMNICGCRCASHIATFNRVKGGYKFVAGDENKFLSDLSIENAYRSKIYSSSLEQEAKKLK